MKSIIPLWVTATCAAACGGSSGTADAPGPAADAPVFEIECSAAGLALPVVDTTYYLATDEPGASNDACDGRSPTDAGGGHCPFKDLGAAISRGLATNAAGVRIELRAGTYVVSDFDGWKLSGAGQDDTEPLVVSAYGDEHPVLDVAAPDLEACAVPAPPPGCVRQVVKLEGERVILQGLTLRNGLAYDVEVSGANHLVRCNRFDYTRDFSMRSDQAKVYASDTTLRHNEFTGWRSQAIDMAGASGGGLVIEDNDFHDPSDRGCGATGIKLGARGITVRGNLVHDIQSPHCTGVRTLLGGGGTEESDRPIEYSASEIVVENNRIWNTNAVVAGFASCANCAFVGNEVTNAPAGWWVQSYVTGNAGCAASASGCLPSTGVRVTGNRVKVATAPETFLSVDAGEATGLVSADNLYCATAPTDALFGWNGVPTSFAAWTTAAADSTSVVVPADDPRCAAF